MDLKDLIESESAKQVKAIAALEKKLGANAAKLQKELYALIRDKFMDSLARDPAGNLLYTAENLNRVNNMVNVWEYYQQTALRPEIIELGKDLLSVVDIEEGYFAALGKKFDITFEFDKVRDLISKQVGITLGRTPEIIKGSYLDRLADASQVRDKITDIVLENVSGRSSVQALKSTLSEVIQGAEGVNGAMERYMHTYAYDSFTNVQRAVDLHTADAYGFNCFVYSGSLIKDSRDFCIEHLGEVICRDQFEEFEAMDWQGKNPDVPFEISLGGYNCRHVARWIPDEGKKYFEKDKE